MARVSPLTNTEVKQAKPKEKVYLLADGGGLQFRVKANGSKLWQLRYTNPYTKKPALMGFGSYPAVSLADARKIRESTKELLAKGLNPKDERDEQNHQTDLANNNTLKHITEKWFEVTSVINSKDPFFDKENTLLTRKRDSSYSP